MFTTNQIVNATKLAKEFSRIAQHLQKNPQALLITRKNGEYLVLVNADIFENLLRFQYEARSAGFNGTTAWGDEQG